MVNKTVVLAFVDPDKRVYELGPWKGKNVSAEFMFYEVGAALFMSKKKRGFLSTWNDCRFMLVISQ